MIETNRVGKVIKNITYEYIVFNLVLEKITYMDPDDMCETGTDDYTLIWRNHCWSGMIEKPFI